MRTFLLQSCKKKMLKKRKNFVVAYYTAPHRKGKSQVYVPPPEIRLNSSQVLARALVYTAQAYTKNTQNLRAPR